MDQKKKTKYYFNRVPSRLMQQYTLLSSIDRDLLGQIVAWEGNDCFLTVDFLTEVVLVCGEKAFYRSVHKLQMLGLIRFKRGNRKRPNRYRFNEDPSHWRLPQPLQSQIAGDYQTLHGEELHFLEKAYPNEHGFKLAFNAAYPKYQLKLGKEPVGEVTGMPVTQDLTPEEKVWDNLLGSLEKHMPDQRIIREYYRSKCELRQLRIASKEELRSVKNRYLTALERKFDLIQASPPNKLILDLLRLGVDLENQGRSGEEIQAAMKSWYDLRKAEEPDIEPS